MWSLIPLLSVPIIIMLIFRSIDPEHEFKFTWGEFLLLEVIMSALLTGGFVAAREGSMLDHETWSGRITKKEDGTQHCCHCREECDTCTRTNADGSTESYSCHCREVCDHSRDYFWSLRISTGDTIKVQDCSASSNPPRLWTEARVGEPAVVRHSFRNYLLADPESVLRQEATVVGKAPPYPRIYGLYKTDRVINMGTAINVPTWNIKLDEVLADLGKKKKVNIIIVATSNPDPAFAQVIERDWLYGKLNDAIFVLGAPDKVHVDWAAVVTLPTGNRGLHLAGRDQLVGLDLSNPDEIAKIISVVNTEWRWSGIEDLAYLGAAAKPSTGWVIALYAFAVIGSVIGSMAMINNNRR